MIGTRAGRIELANANIRVRFRNSLEDCFGHGRPAWFSCQFMPNPKKKSAEPLCEGIVQMLPRHTKRTDTGSCVDFMVPRVLFSS